MEKIFDLKSLSLLDSSKINQFKFPLLDSNGLTHTKDIQNKEFEDAVLNLPNNTSIIRRRTEGDRHRTTY